MKPADIEAVIDHLRTARDASRELEDLDRRGDNYDGDIATARKDELQTTLQDNLAKAANDLPPLADETDNIEYTDDEGNTVTVDLPNPALEHSKSETLPERPN